MLDYAYSTVNEMEILNVQPTKYVQRIASLLKDAAYEIQQGVLRLENHPSVATEHAQRAKALENRVEQVYREAIADLFSGPDNIGHVVQMLKMREVYRHLSNAADRSVVIEDNRAGTGCALIQCQDERHTLNPRS